MSPPFPERPTGRDRANSHEHTWMKHCYPVLRGHPLEKKVTFAGICRNLQELSAFSGQHSALDQGPFFLLAGGIFLPPGRKGCGGQ